MVTKLDKVLKRELAIDGNPYVLAISPEGMKLTEKGRRKGLELTWKTLVSGEEALVRALQSSVGGQMGGGGAADADDGGAEADDDQS